MKRTNEKIINSSAYGEFSKPRTMEFKGLRLLMYIKLMSNKYDKIIVKYYNKSRTLKVKVYKNNSIDILHITRPLHYNELYFALVRQELLKKVKVISNVRKTKR